MKHLFEEYGMIILSVIIILVLIGLANGLGDTIMNALNSIIESFSAKVTNAFNTGI